MTPALFLSIALSLLAQDPAGPATRPVPPVAPASAPASGPASSPASGPAEPAASAPASAPAPDPLPAPEPECVAFDEPPVVDGDVAEWAGRTAVELGHPSQLQTFEDSPLSRQWQGTADASMRAWLGFDRDNLYLAGEVTDDLRVHDDHTWWLGDCIDLFLDFAQDGVRPVPGDDFDQIVLLPFNPGRPFGVAQRGRTRMHSDGGFDGVRVASRPRADLGAAGYSFELAIPLANFRDWRRDQREFGVNLTLTDHDVMPDGSRRQSFLSLLAGEGRVEPPAKLVTARFVGEPQRAAALTDRVSRFAPWAAALLVALVLIVLTAWTSRSLFQWVDRRVRSWRRVGVVVLVLLAFSALVAPIVVELFLERSVAAKFEDRAQLVGRVVADLSEELAWREGRGLDRPRALIDLLSGRPVTVRPAFDCAGIPLRRATEDPQLKRAIDGVVVRDSDVPVPPSSTIAFPLPRPMPIERLFVFGTARLDETARSRPGAAAVKEQAIEIGVRLVDGQTVTESFPVADHDLAPNGRAPDGERRKLGFLAEGRPVDEYEFTRKTAPGALVRAVVVSVREPDVSFRVRGVTIGKSADPADLAPLVLLNTAIVAAPAELFDGAPARGSATVTRAPGRRKVTVPVGAAADGVWLFYSTTDARVVDPSLAGAEVARATLRDTAGGETTIVLQAGIHVTLGRADPAARDAPSQLALRWSPEKGASLPVEVVQRTFPSRTELKEIDFENTGELTSISLYAVTTGILAETRVGASGLLVATRDQVVLRPDVAEAVGNLGLAVFADDKVAEVQFPDAAFQRSLLGASYPLGGDGADRGGGDVTAGVQRARLSGERWLLRYFPLARGGGAPYVLACAERVTGLALLERVRKRAAFGALLLAIPFLLMYLLDAATRIPRVRWRLTMLLVATSLVPIVVLFVVLYGVVSGDRARLRESQATAALSGVEERIDQLATQVRRIAIDISDAAPIAELRRGAAPEAAALQSAIAQLVQLQPVSGLDLAVQLDVERANAPPLRVHDDPTGAVASRFDVASDGPSYHWEELLFVGTHEERGEHATTRVRVAAKALPTLLSAVGGSARASVSILSPRGFPIAGFAADDSRDAAERARHAEEAREQNHAVVREDDRGRLVATGLLKGDDGAPIGLLEVALPRDPFVVDTPLFAMPLDMFFFWFCVIGLAAAVFMGAVATGRITGPLENLESAARRIAEGDLNVGVDSEAEDEVGRLARSFHAMTEKLKRRAAERDRLERAQSELSRTIAPDDVVKTAARTLAEHPSAKECLLYRLDLARGRLVRAWPVPGAGATPEPWPLELDPGPLLARVLKQDRPLVIPAAEGDEPPPDPSPAERALVAEPLTVMLPLTAPGHAVGVAVLTYGPDVTHKQLVQSRFVLQQLSGQIAVALENARLYQLAIADPATGLYVEPYFHNRLKEEVDRAQHAGTKLALIRFELAGLARLKRLLGPDPARDALAAAARVVKAEARDMYLVARADRVFLVLCPQSDRDAAIAFAARARRAVEALEVGKQGDKPLRLNLNSGVAAFPGDGQSAAFLLDAANRDLGESRRRQVAEPAREPPAEGEAPELDLHPYVFQSAAMKALLAQVAKVSNSTASVLILGETGVGKEVIAELLHRWSDRSHRPLVTLNCSAVPETLLEAELFGFEKGSFTGALRAKPGLLELADGGTVFLDEIGDMPLALQAKLLRVLQDRKVARIGSRQPVEVDVRIVAATNADLAERVQHGGFRKDLYFRLKVVALSIPPLRERREDLPALVDLFVRQFNEEHGRSVQGLAPAAFDRLYQYEWPGNVRELKNTLARAMLLSDSDLVAPQALTFEGAGFSEPTLRRETVAEVPATDVTNGGPTANSGAGAATAPAPLPPPTPVVNERQSRVVERLKTGGVIRSREYCELVGVPERTGLRDLNDLVRRGVLERLGSRRGAVYRLSDRASRQS